MSLPKTLFLTEYYRPLRGGTCNKFANRCGLYPPEQIVVVTNTVEHADNFDKTVNYLIKRISFRLRGPKGFEYMGIVWDLLKTGLPLTREHNIEVIECARPLPEAIAGYVIAKLLRKKLVINFQGEDISVFQNYKVERFLMKVMSRAAHLNIANSTFTESLIKNLGGPNVKTGIVFPGFNPKSLHVPVVEKVPQLRERFGGAPIILTVGRFQRRKGQDNVIRALPEVIKHFPELKYVIVGSTKVGTAGFIDEIKELIEQLGLGQNVVLVGEVENEDLPLYYAACDLFIMANRSEPGGDLEGFGAVFLEAGFFEKPVIGGNSGGVPDAVQHNKTGLLVDGNSVKEIAQGMLKILSNPGLAQEMGKQGKAFALSLTHEKVFEKYHTLMTELVL